MGGSDAELQGGLPPGAYEAIPGEDYVPYVPADTAPPELTLRAVLVGVVIGVVFGAANAYLGLKVGLTVSASIPAAVIGVAIFRMMRGGHILESNLVQTIGSAGESLAAGVIFTVPAFFIWGADVTQLRIFMMALVGGLLGVLFMIPLRNYLIVGEHGKLPYPEGTACAEVLVNNQAGATKAPLLFAGMGVGAIYQALMKGEFLGLWKSDPRVRFNNYELSAEVTPELVGVGYIIGPQIAALMLSGAALGMLVLVPLLASTGGPEIQAMDLGEIRGTYVRLIGAGAVACGGIVTLIRSLPTIVESFRKALAGLRAARGGAVAERRTMTDIPFTAVGPMLGLLIVLAALLPLQMGVTGLGGSLLLGLCVTIFSFFFVTVSSRIVGLIGSSSNPISGMTIATILITAALFVAFGLVDTGEGGLMHAREAVLSVGGMVCIAAAIAGDTSQDLKTGFLLGATPRSQQVGEIVGVISSALAMCFVIFLFKADIASGVLQAPQANLMSLLIDGVVGGTLDWNLIILGAIIAGCFELLSLPSLAMAVGLYLPLALSTPIFIGGLVRWWTERSADAGARSEARERGVLYSSGLIAGAALIGVAITALIGVGELSGAVKELVEAAVSLTDGLTDGPSFAIFLALTASLWWVAHGKGATKGAA